MKRVFICSPLRGDVERNTMYLKRALLDSIQRGEAPFAPHAIYPSLMRTGFQEEHDSQIAMGLEWLAVADLIAIYSDYGISQGMMQEINQAALNGPRVEFRRIGTRDIHEVEYQQRPSEASASERAASVDASTNVQVSGQTEVEARIYENALKLSRLYCEYRGSDIAERAACKATDYAIRKALKAEDDEQRFSLEFGPATPVRNGGSK